jgi:hypothetical protein
VGGTVTSAGPTQGQLDAIERIAAALEPGTYLVGGVAVGLKLRHRTSLDVDLFVPQDFDPGALFERIRELAPDVTLTGEARGTLHLELHGLPVSILAYRYRLLREPTPLEGISVAVASAEDLLCMKLAAIGGRGAAKDFWDLQALLESGTAHGDLREALELFREKYPANDVGHVVKALAYFGDADAAPLPAGLTAEAWAAVKRATAARLRAL